MDAWNIWYCVVRDEVGTVLQSSRMVDALALKAGLTRADEDSNPGPHDPKSMMLPLRHSLNRDAAGDICDVTDSGESPDDSTL